MKKQTNRILTRAKIILIFSVSVFLIVCTCSTSVFVFYGFVNRVPFLELSSLPRHTSSYLIATTSILLGLVISLLFRKFILRPIYRICAAIDKISECDYSVNLPPTGLGSIRTLISKLNAMSSELSSIEAMRNDFVNNFSHEFKTPIISIEGFAKLLKNGNLSEEEKKEYLDIIINESGRLAELSSNILYLTKLENKNTLNEFSTFNVSEQVRLSAVMVNNKWRDKNIDFSFEGEDYTITANEQLLSQLWTNLIDNAFKYSPDNSQVIISLKRVNSDIVVNISDEGKGMSETEIKHAFDKFYQGDISHKTNGNGIGLTVAKKICVLHNGTINIKKSDENGTVFEVILPVTPDQITHKKSH